MTASPTPPLPRGVPRILIADDNGNFRAAVRDALVYAGYEVEMVADGLQVLSAIERSSLTLVLLDLRMPNLDGLGVLEHLRRTGNAPPVIVMTAQYDGDTEALSRGAAGVLLKPVTLEALLSTVRTFVA
jgi:DNA-binding response OmpR family regulator